MVIAMWRDIPEGLIPMPMPDSGRPWPRTDLGDFKTMESKVLGIRDGCLGVVVGAGRRRWRLGHERWGRAGKEEEGGGGGGLGFVNPTGYDVAGVNGGIGVFLWATGSLMDGLVREEGETAGVVGSGNLTVGGGDDGRGNATRWGAGLATGDFV